MGRQRNSVEASPPADYRMIGYARVSTDDQDLTMQLDALRRAGVMDVNLYSDKRSGRTLRRPGLEAALFDCRPGDVLLVWKLDRLARSIEDLISLSKRLADDGVHMRSIQDQIDTTTAIGTLFFHFMAALAQFESSLIGERTRAAMAAARERGVRFGPSAKFGDKQLGRAIDMLRSGKSPTQVAKRFGVTSQVVRMKVLAATGKKLWKPKIRKTR